MTLTMYYLFLILYSIECKKPISKKLQATWRLECELGIVSDPDCPIDGGWSPWSTWSDCYGACDNVGHRKRIRKCNNPSPSKDGMPCRGSELQTDPCYLRNCTVEDFRKLVETDTSRTEALQQLTPIPALVEQCLQTECPFEEIEATLAKENIWQFNSEAIWNALQCVKHDIGCALKGEWGSWGAWADCGALCGKGLKWKIRSCDSPPPSAAHLVCSGTPIKYKECEGEQCAIDGEYLEHNISGSWGMWGQWTKCSEACGIGIRRRKRVCKEKHVSLAALNWGTHCRGQYDQLEICNSIKCVLDGGWSGWTSWGPCSQTCGAGRRARVRSCTRPIPSDNGKLCMGSKFELGSCNLSPCEAYSHTVAIFNGDSILQYNMPNRRSTFLHFYIRFMSLSPHGTLLRRGPSYNPRFRLSLQKWHVCLDINGASKSCSIPHSCSPSTIEPSTWYSILIAVTNDAATLRINDEQTPIQISFPCDPEFSNDKINVFVGERFRGEVQELILNFTPLKLLNERERKNIKYDFHPSAASNIAYETANIDEAYLNLENGQFLILPCFEDQEEWKIDITLKSQNDAGTILLLSNYDLDTWFFVGLQNMRLKMKLVHKDFQSEATSTLEYFPDQWLHLIFKKKRNTNTIVANVNFGERFHVFSMEYFRNKRNVSNNTLNKTEHDANSSTENFICNEEFFVGGAALEKNKIPEDITPFVGIIAAIRINNYMINIHDVSVERNVHGVVQLSSRSASVSGSYHETTWGESSKLNLTCVHARLPSYPRFAYWFYLDTAIEMFQNQRSVDDGKVLRLFITGDNDCQGFYTCRGQINKRTRNLVTYGVLGKISLKLGGPDTITIIAMFTTLSLVIFTLSWLAIEGYHDIRDGYGFFRDVHLSPEEEAEVVCKYIDQNTHLMGSESAVNIAKSKARRHGRRLASRASFGVQEPEVMLRKENGEIFDEFTSEPEHLPDLPIMKCSIANPSHEVYRCAPRFISLPRHDSTMTFRSSSSLDKSPRTLPSSTKTRKISNEKLSMELYKNLKNQNYVKCIKPNKKLLMFNNTSPVQRVLQKFKDIKSDVVY